MPPRKSTPRRKCAWCPQGEGFAIDRIALTLKARVPGMDEAKFQQVAQAAKRDCPLSKALASVPEIALTATLRP